MTAKVSKCEIKVPIIIIIYKKNNNYNHGNEKCQNVVR